MVSATRLLLLFLAAPCIAWGFPGGSVGKESACDAGDTGDVGLIPVLGRAPGEENGNPFQYCLLGYPMVGGAWWAIVHGVSKSQVWLSNWVCTYTCMACGILILWPGAEPRPQQWHCWALNTGPQGIPLRPLPGFLTSSCSVISLYSFHREVEAGCSSFPHYSHILAIGKEENRRGGFGSSF